MQKLTLSQKSSHFLGDAIESNAAPEDVYNDNTWHFSLMNLQHMRCHTQYTTEMPLTAVYCIYGFDSKLMTS